MGILGEKVSRGWRFATYGLAGIVLGSLINTISPEQVKHVQRGYSTSSELRLHAPDRLRIELQDLDGKGDKEIIMIWGGQQTPIARLMYDSTKPSPDAYEVKLAEVVPKSE